MKQRTALAGTALAITALGLTACGGTPDPSATAASACQELATATSISNLALPNGVGNAIYPASKSDINTMAEALAHAQTDIQDEQSSIPQPLRHDLGPLLAGNTSSPTQAEVAKVSGDCTTYGVAAAIWPQFMTS